MAKDLMRYDRMVEEALRGVVRRALMQAATNGLPGQHHFYLTFRTDQPGVTMPDYLRERYPHEMTIVLQYQFLDLQVTDAAFSVTLSFNNVQERLVIPLAAISVFADPSVNFALQLQASDGEPAPAATTLETPPEQTSDKAADREKGSGQVVSLDQFRRK